MFHDESMMEDCAVCISELKKDLYCTECNHKFHLTCILQWVNTQHKNDANISCPMCRGAISRETVRQKYQDLNPNKDINIGLSIKEFLEMPGVSLFYQRAIILDLDVPTWYSSFGKMLSINTIQRRHHSHIPVDISLLKVGEYDVYFRTNRFTYTVTKSKVLDFVRKPVYDYSIAISSDDEDIEVFNKLDQVFQQYIAPAQRIDTYRSITNPEHDTNIILLQVDSNNFNAFIGPNFVDSKLMLEHKGKNQGQFVFKAKFINNQLKHEISPRLQAMQAKITSPRNHHNFHLLDS